MQNKKELRFIIAEKSYIIREGLRKIIEDFRADAQIIEITEKNKLQNMINKHNPDVVLLNIKLINDPHDDIRKLFNPKISSKFIALVGTRRKNEHFAYFDNQICIDDNKVGISKVLTEIEASLPENPEQTNTSELSERELDILRQVALGKTNKEIADILFISTHTVITHRKNITKKIGIKTVSGLTVYAILNNVISIEEAS